MTPMWAVATFDPWLASSDLELTNVLHFAPLPPHEKRRHLTQLRHRSLNNRHRYNLDETLGAYGEQICGFLTYDVDKDAIREQVTVLRGIGEKVFGLMEKSSTLDWSDNFDVSLCLTWILCFLVH